LLGIVGIGGAVAMSRRRHNRVEDGYTVPAREMMGEPAYTPPVAPASIVAGTYTPSERGVAATPTIARQGAASSGSLEQMVAESPSPENPFLTRKNRLRRATFLKREQDENVIQVSAPEPIAPRIPEPVAAREPARTSVTHNFGKGSMEAIRPRNWKPATS
jgi:hypothetical protein